MAVRLHPLARRLSALGLVAAGALSLAACAAGPSPSGRTASLSLRPGGGSAHGGRTPAYNRPYEVRGRWYTPVEQPGYDQVGLASWYSYESRSRTTADGESFDPRLATAAHTTLPIPSWLEVTNLDNGRSARVRLNDRGPFVSGRLLDLSRGAAEELGFASRGTARVRVRYLGPAEPNRLLWAKAAPATPMTDRLGLAALAPRAAPPGAGGFSAARSEVAEDAAQDDPADQTGREEGAPPERHQREAMSVAEDIGAGGYAVQVGAFADRRNAERAAERLSAAGAPRIRPLARADGAVLYRVLVGGWTGADEAASARAAVVALGFADAKVVTP